MQDVATSETCVREGKFFFFFFFFFARREGNEWWNEEVENAVMKKRMVFEPSLKLKTGGKTNDRYKKQKMNT